MGYCDKLECWQEIPDNAKFCRDHDGSASGSNKLDLSGLSDAATHLHHTHAPADLSKAIALTQAAINNLGGPIHASMIDHQPVDLSLAQARTQIAISHQGEKHADSHKLPADRALAEALTLNAIAHNPQDKLKQTGRRSSTEAGLTAEQQAALLHEAQAEKDRKAAARVFGGGDIKEGMAAIRGEIEHQGIISVPHDKVPDENITLNQIKTLAQINAIEEGKGPRLSHVEKPIVDHGVVEALTMKALSSDAARQSLTHHEPPDDLSLALGKTLYAIEHLGDKKLAHHEDGHGSDRPLVEALTMKALNSEATKDKLKNTGRRSSLEAVGMSVEELTNLQAAAKQEKEAGAEGEPTPTIHMPKPADQE